MGCSGSKPGVQESMENVRVNPVKALPNLMTALDKPIAKGQEEGAKLDTTPKVFELLPKAISSLSLKDTKAVVAACDVIKCCVKFANANDPAVGACAPFINASSVNQCVSQLSSLLRMAQSQGGTTYREHFMDDEACSVVVQSIAGAMTALFHLEKHGTACRQEFTGAGGLKSASDSVCHDSGIDAKKAIVIMFLAFVETPEGAKDFIQNGCIAPILPYCLDAVKYGITREFQRTCMQLLESLLVSGQDIQNRDVVQAAFEKANNPKSSFGS